MKRAAALLGFAALIIVVAGSVGVILDLVPTTEADSPCDGNTCVEIINLSYADQVSANKFTIVGKASNFLPNQDLQVKVEITNLATGGVISVVEQVQTK